MKKFFIILITCLTLSGCTHVETPEIAQKEYVNPSCSELTQSILTDFANNIAPKGDKDYSHCEAEIKKLPFEAKEITIDLYKKMPYIYEDAKENLIELKNSEEVTNIISSIKEGINNIFE